LTSEFKAKPEAIKWRRGKVIELKSQGLEQMEIARILQVSPGTISLDLKFMRKEALENIRDYTTRELPLQLKIFIKAMHNAIAIYWKLSQEAKDDRDKMDAMERYLEAHTNLWVTLSGAERFEKYLGSSIKSKDKQALTRPPVIGGS
jgi:transposase